MSNLRWGTLLLLLFLMEGGANRACSALLPSPDSRGVEVMEGKGDYVVVVHGWAWLRETMRPTSRHLNAQGYHVVSVFYDPRTEMPGEVAEQRISPAIGAHCVDQARKIHFVGHSMGCLAIREYLARHHPEQLGRVVLLAPPNHGIEVVDRIRDWPLFVRVFGEPARQLGTGKESIAGRLGAADYPVGIIMGRDVGIPVLSAILPGPDDGIVAVESGRLEGMCDFTTVRCIHMTMPGNRSVLRQTTAFLRDGLFGNEEAADEGRSGGRTGRFKTKRGYR